MDKATELNNEGVQHFLNRQFDKAEKCYQKALELQPDNVTALNNMGLLCHQKRQYSEAIEFFEKAIGINPKETYYVNAGNSAAHLKNMQEAESYYLKALEVNGNSKSARESLAKLYEYNKRLKEAAEIWAGLIETTGDEKYIMQYVKNLITRNSYREALNIINRQPLNKDNSDVWYCKGVCEYHLKNYGMAESSLKKALAIDPDKVEIRQYLAVTYIAMGDGNKGLSEFDKCLKINPDNFYIMTEKGVVLLSRNKLTEALELFEKALSINPEFEKAKKYREMARQLIRNTGEK